MKAPVREFEVPKDQQDAIYTALASRVSDDEESLSEVPASYMEVAPEVPVSSLAAVRADYEDGVVLRDEDEKEPVYNEAEIEALPESYGSPLSTGEPL